MPVTLARLKSVVPTLNELQFGLLTRGVLGLGSRKDQEVTPGVQLQVLVYEFLMHLGCLIDSQAHTAVLRMGPSLGAYAEAPDAQAVYLAHLVGSRWLCWPGAVGWLDLLTGDETPEYPGYQPLVVTCNVTALWKRSREWLARLE
jgi:hypothetical protein